MNPSAGPGATGAGPTPKAATSAAARPADTHFCSVARSASGSGTTYFTHFLLMRGPLAETNLPRLARRTEH